MADDKSDLVLRAHHPHYPVDIRLEADVEHAVGLIEDHEIHPERA